MLPNTNNINTLGSSNWIAQIDLHESLVLNLTGFELPSVSIGITALGSRSEFIYQGGGNNIVYGTLALNFLVNEDMSNYRKLHQWMREGVAAPDSGQSTQTSIFVHVLNGKKQFQGQLIEFIFCHPIELSKIEFDTDGNNSAVTASVTFAYTAFNFIDATTMTPPK